MLKFNVYLSAMSALVMTPPRVVFQGAEASAHIVTLKQQSSETRESGLLNDIWNFRKSPPDPEYGFKHEWYKSDLSSTGPVLMMPVPSSYNDMTLDMELRDHVGLVWYDYTFFAPIWWMKMEQRVWIRFDSVHYAAQVTGPVLMMPVPSSYNDMTLDKELRDHVGLVWYDYTFFVPIRWMKAEQRVWIRFDSVHYAAQIWLNGKSIMYHEIGGLPFCQEVTMHLFYGKQNRITVAVDNTLLKDTVPQGYVSEIQTDNGTKLKQYYTFDFFNYAGIHRDVSIYTTPILYIDDIIVTTDIDNTTGIIEYTVVYGGYSGEEEVTCYIKVEDKDGNVVAEQIGLSNTILIQNATFWWPIYMNDTVGYMYTMVVHLSTASKKIEDIYRQRVGIRTVTWDHQKLYVNNVPVYLRGFGKHEDFIIRGRSIDDVVIVHDSNLIQWIGGNSFRTSHYPYSESVMDVADSLGFMIIGECPSVDTDYFSDALLAKHMDSLTELIRRDKNHPSVIMWSLANEPRTQHPEADMYFHKVANHARSLDHTRPLTIALSRSFAEDKVGQHLDIISFNRYNGWYSNPGRLDMVTDRVVAEAKAWYTKYNKPVIMSEYGADTFEGLHIYPGFVWSEEYQVELMSKHFKAFDILREMGFFIGEFIWNFADFKTDQTYTRVGGNKKGLFTRARDPKSSAFFLRKRYKLLASQVDNSTPPDDLFLYVAPNKFNDEL